MAESYIMYLQTVHGSSPIEIAKCLMMWCTSLISYKSNTSKRRVTHIRRTQMESYNLTVNCKRTRACTHVSTCKNVRTCIQVCVSARWAESSDRLLKPPPAFPRSVACSSWRVSNSAHWSSFDWWAKGVNPQAGELTMTHHLLQLVWLKLF